MAKKKEVNNANEHPDKEIYVTTSDTLQKRLQVLQLAVGSWQLAKKEETKKLRNEEGQRTGGYKVRTPVCQKRKRGQSRNQTPQMKVDAQRKVVRKLDLDKAVETRNKEIAKKMKNKGSDIDFISEITGLSTEEIEKL